MDLISSVCLVYLDNILICKDGSEHAKHLMQGIRLSAVQLLFIVDAGSNVVVLGNAVQRSQLLRVDWTLHKVHSCLRLLNPMHKA